MWYQLQIRHCEPDAIEALSDALEETGALSITLTDEKDHPVLEPAPGTTPLWPEILVNAIYSTAEDAQRALQQLTPQYPELHFALSTLEDKNWERVWMEDFKPQLFWSKTLDLPYLD